MNAGGLSYFFLTNPILVAVLTAHLVTDFQLQSQRLADLKMEKFIYVCFHLLIVALPLIVLSLFFPYMTSYFLLVLMSHFIIDTMKYLSQSFFQKRGWERFSFLIDQSLHIICIVMLYQLVAIGQTPQWLVEKSGLLQTILFFVAVGKPVNIFFKLFFNKYQAEQNHQETIAGAGAMIGMLERFIMALSLLFGQFASIGLVFTAKSIARYNKISESQSFAEYYLIGSLFSMISVLVVYGLLYL